MKNRNFLFWIDSKFRFFAPLTQYYSTFWEPKNINFDWIWNFLKIKNWMMVGISENLAAKLKSIKWFNFKCSPSCQKFQATPLNLWLSGRLSGWLNSIISFLYFFNFFKIRPGIIENPLRSIINFTLFRFYR